MGTAYLCLELYLWGARSLTEPPNLVVHQLMILLSGCAAFHPSLAAWWDADMDSPSPRLHPFHPPPDHPLFADFVIWITLPNISTKIQIPFISVYSIFQRLPLKFHFDETMWCPPGSYQDCFYCRLALYALCLIGLWHSPQRPGGALMGRGTMALMERMQTSSNAVVFTEASVVTEVLFLMWKESAHHGRGSSPLAQRKPFWLNEVQINLVQSDARNTFLSSPEETCLCPSATYVKLATLVCWFRGSFRAVLFCQAEPVFPDWRMMMMFVTACVSMLLWQIQFEGNRLILCLKACFSISDWPVCVLYLLPSLESCISDGRI